ncbi:hypothetical protein L4D76_17610 [Photobacterium sagamiensis]|uniref:hypothetical protein n=1 Tax=Photobacterium sagamiensis TaxID=2910241 RepID=UPI003D0F34C2
MADQQISHISRLICYSQSTNPSTSPIAETMTLLEQSAKQVLYNQLITSAYYNLHIGQATYLSRKPFANSV